MRLGAAQELILALETLHRWLADALGIRLKNLLHTAGPPASKGAFPRNVQDKNN